MAQESSLADKVAALSNPLIYGAREAVTYIETHMSWVFLVDDSAYKLKKPVRRPMLDFTTLELRREYCEAEVVLNQRLTRNVYRGVLPLVECPDRRLALGADGRVVDWLVWTRRLERTVALDFLIASWTKLHDSQIGDLADWLARFYQTTRKVTISPDDYVETLRSTLLQLSTDLKAPSLGLPPESIDEVTGILMDFLEKDAECFRKRALDERIVEGHGDLRPEHVFFEERPQIIDCLEFNYSLRCLDVISDLALLELECWRLGAADLGRQIVTTCMDKMGDRVPRRLGDFHVATKALQRALLAVWHNLEPNADIEKWLNRASLYLDQARAIASSL